LKSYIVYGKTNTKYLIITNESFISKIQNIFNTLNINGTIWSLNLNSKFEAGYSRLKIFDYPEINNYNKILYLDCDVLIANKIDNILNLILEDKLYALKEGNTNHLHWGSQFFENNPNISGFTSGVLLFNNSSLIKNLFKNILTHIESHINNNLPIPECLDQPFIVYHSIINNLYNNELLINIVINNPVEYNGETILHFPGNPGDYEDKIVKMLAFWQKMNSIPKVLFQTNKTSLDKYVIDMICLRLSSEWNYEFYNDDDVIQFFINNPLNDLPDIIEKYNSIIKGAHKADLFRYYYLYINGGFFMDSDAMLYVNIDTIVKNYNFVSVNSSCHPGTIFQGILGASPKNEIIKKALYKAYNTNPDILNNNYHYFCSQLYDIVKENNFEYNIKLYEEKRTNPENGDDILEGNTILCKHYWLNKTIPNIRITKITNWNEYNSNELHEFDYRILIAYDITSNKLIRIGPNEDGGYIIADGFDYDLFISCGIANDIRFEESFLDIYKTKCIAFDGTIESLPPHRNNIEWIKKNIGYINSTNITNLKEYIQNNKKIFLKMDIEGSEFNWIDSMSEEELENFSQIVIEFHWPFDIYRMNMLKKLNTTHYIIHVHGNNGPGLYNIRNISHDYIDIDIPEVFEVTYVNKKLFNTPLKKIHKNYPINGLDYGNHPNQNIKQLEFYIPNCDNSFYIGSSNENSKILKIKNKILLGHNLLNTQNPSWGDTFDIKIVNNELLIKRIDLNCGWGQKIIIPIKYNKILVYNGFPFHYEMIGFILDFSKKYNIEIDLVLTHFDNYWIDLYKTKYIFNVLNTLPSDLEHYLFVLLLTDDDKSFPDNIITENVVCIDHYYKNRREKIKHHIPIAPFKEDIYLYALPIFEYINYEDKINFLNKNSRPIISFLGSSTMPYDNKSLSIIDNINDFDLYIINRNIPENYINLPNIFLFENIPATELFEILTRSTYICYIPNNTLNGQMQNDYKSISACIPISFTTGCKLILPKNINKFLKLKSIIEYSHETKLILNKTPSFIETFNERKKLLNIRDDSIFDLKHMKMFLECKYSDWNNYNKNEIDNFMYNILTTYKVPNNLIRIGPQEDGGYVIVDNINYDLFISCGIANDVRFEESFLDIHKVKCIAFDGTIESLPPHRNNMEWIKKNIGYINTSNITNLKEYIEDKSNIFLKMDIEGSEFNWLDSMSTEDLNKFNQIIMEIHWPFDTYRASMLNKLNTTHYLVHIHGNNYCDRDIPKHLPSGRTYDGTVTINNNLGIITLPEVFEVTYLKKSLFNNNDIKPIEINFPTILDFPNNPHSPDISFSIPINK
jgi:lipopolysaccharide biosynthesis glycosyltransferase